MLVRESVDFASLGAEMSLVDRNSDTLQETLTKCIAASVNFFINIAPLAIVADITTDAKKIID